MPSALKRIPFLEIDNFVDRTFDRSKILDLLKLAVKQANSSSKRLLFLEGDPGIGKTILLGDLQQHIVENYRDWRVLGPYDAYDFVHNNPYAQFIALMNECAGKPLHTLTNPQTITIEEVIQCASKLEMEFTSSANEPLIIIFDELEWWLDLDDERRETLDHLFRIVWRVLLRQSAMPCVIIGAGRRLPVFRDVLLRRTLETIQITGFANNDLQRLISESGILAFVDFILNQANNNLWVVQILDHALQANPKALEDVIAQGLLLRQVFDQILAGRPNADLIGSGVVVFVDFILSRANGNAWVTQLLEYALQVSPEAIADPVARELLLGQVFDQILAGRIEADLAEVLYNLARHRPDGFYDDDELLPERSQTITRLMRTSYASFDPDKGRYFVALVLSSLFNPLQS